MFWHCTIAQGVKRNGKCLPHVKKTTQWHWPAPEAHKVAILLVPIEMSFSSEGGRGRKGGEEGYIPIPEKTKFNPYNYMKARKKIFQSKATVQQNYFSHQKLE